MRDRNGAPFGRVLTAMVTPFDTDGNVNYEQAAKLAQALIDSGTEGLVVTGTTGEGPTLTAEEKAASSMRPRLRWPTATARISSQAPQPTTPPKASSFRKRLRNSVRTAS